MARDDQRSTTLVRRQLGRLLKEAREGAGLTQEQAGRLLEMGKATVGRLEKGENDKVKQRDVDAIGNVYGLPPEKIAELKALAAQTATKPWWQASRHLIYPGYNTYLGLEAGASQLQFYQPLIVPGILQTPDYARAIEQPYRPTDTPADVETRVALRMQRAAVLTRRYKPARAEFVLHENVLHTVVGSRDVMAGVCRHLADMSTRENVSIRIVPYMAGNPTHTVPTPYIIIDFPPESREPSVVYTETTTGTMIFEEEADLKEFRDIHETLERAALGEQESKDRLRTIARRYKP
ncbi:helix-turn-helix domain-containing protein [Nocardia sp. NPDC050630]|uniref:helix-turn-helix domain-containing protein n=1 Tax=Nocardia sp. NPDC050630 TaxID=3364321 RepID=UPI0037995799